MQHGANAGMKRTSVVGHNLNFARLAIVGLTSSRNLKGQDRINNNYNTSYNHYYNINLKPKFQNNCAKNIGAYKMHK
jgi:hypothetical protein